MRVIVTRPAAQAAEWVLQLRGRAIDAVALPLLRIVPTADPAPLRAAWQGLAGRGLVFFVSPNAADCFFAARPDGAPWPPATRAASPGPGTSRTLAARGVPPACIVEPAADAPQFDSDTLWLELRSMPWSGVQVLVVRGDGGRDLVAERLRAAGAVVDHLEAYRRAPPVFDAAGEAVLRSALAEPSDQLWFFSSSEAIDHLAACAPGADFGRARALATHPRIAARARRQGFGEVLEARPALEAVVACIQSLPP